MAFLKIIFAGIFTFFVCFQSHAQFETDMGAGIGAGSMDEYTKQCAAAARAIAAFGGAAVEFAADCAKQIGSNVINGIGGMTKVAGAAIFDCIKMGAATCAKNAVSKVSNMADEAREFISLMDQAMGKVRDMLGSIEPRQAALLACELIGSAVAQNALRGGIPAVLAGLSLKLAKFAALGPAALALQKAGVAAELLLTLDAEVWKQVKGLSAKARDLFARESKMCSI